MAKAYKKPNLHASRKREKAVNLLAYPERDPYGFFARTKEQHPDLQQYSNKEIAGWIKSYLEVLADEVVTNRNGVMLPNDLGFVIVSSCKVSEETSNRNINFKASNEAGYQIYHNNIGCEGYIAKIAYTNDIPYHRLLVDGKVHFKACRALKRAVAAEFKKGRQNRYKRFTKQQPISKLFRKQKIGKPTRKQKQAMRAEKANQEYMENYDPFKWD